MCYDPPSNVYDPNEAHVEPIQPQFDELLAIGNSSSESKSEDEDDGQTLSDLMDIDSDRLIMNSTELMKYLAIT